MILPIKKDQPISLKKALLVVTVICWTVPIIVFMVFMFSYYRNNIVRKTEVLMEESLKNYTSFHSQKLNEAIESSKKISYDLVLEKAWRKYENKEMTSSTFYKDVIGNLKSKYINDNRFVMTTFYLVDKPDSLFYVTREQSNYQQTYIREVKRFAEAITHQNTSDAHVKIINGKIYIIRNLYTTRNYTKFGTLVLELNTDKLFEGINMNNDYDLAFFVNEPGEMIYYNSGLKEQGERGVLKQLKLKFTYENNRKTIKAEDKVYQGIVYQQKFDDYYYGAVLIANKDVIFSEIHVMNSLILFNILIIIPVFVYMLYFISHNIAKPMERMVKAAKNIEGGKFGWQIKGEAMPNQEFAYLSDSFNRMSSEVKYLFDYAYKEKLARKEAKILALQSQINPHFLNNTLEMMNWQARMAGDDDVSKMIEALAVLLNQSMGRENRKLSSLAEELKGADAYIYITSMRFGDRIRFERDIDENLLQIQIPQLILQPLLENAVVHGVYTVKGGVINLSAYQNEGKIIIKVTNTGELSGEEERKIQSLLENGNAGMFEGKGKHASLGIRNVNERIKLIFGEDYGLKIYSENGVVISAIEIPCDWEEEGENVKITQIGKNEEG
ncbi:sensor histidine kinase [Anaerocolumna xylanovorans]|uniref:Two-component system, sensor histidine kinase YesM n=1 Tax=Anaerocolumna xylanovorans DSM 12503 TaxID=1121345 RepID=A0A1M7YGL4_9FIRM|nr:histidine kinase [Anaerocolumna xylanovorans]SHO51784.1 two-component system, sensor histidine kinase YesM [Anaerocolumna xylanovorans DSM 12503]